MEQRRDTNGVVASGHPHTDRDLREWFNAYDQLPRSVRLVLQQLNQRFDASHVLELTGVYGVRPIIQELYANEHRENVRFYQELGRAYVGTFVRYNERARVRATRPKRTYR